MSKFHAQNERIKHQYLSYLTEAKRLSEKSADIAMAAISNFEKSTRNKDFKRFHIEQAKRYKRELEDALNANTGKPLSKATINSRLNAVKAFFVWLAGQPSYKSRISYSDCEYFNLSANDTRIANATKPVNSPDLEQVLHVIKSMPFDTDIEKRNRALLALTIATAIRVDALRTLKIKHINLEKGFVFQDANEVNTKFRKTMTTWFFPVGDDITSILKDWITYLKEELHFGGNDPVFPKTKVERTQACVFAATGLTREHWQGAGAIRLIFKQVFECANLPYYHPHSFKHTLTLFGERICKTPEEFKAWSQNLSHENVMTTFTSYGKVSDYRQAEIIKNLGKVSNDNHIKSGEPSSNEIARVLEHLKNQNK
jgi:integrase